MQNLTVPKILLGLLFAACASSADTLFADTVFLYQMSYDATSGPIQSFGASFVSQNLLTGFSGRFAFNPFTITDGTNTWVMGQGIASSGRIIGGECLNFGTLTSFLLACGVEVFSDHEGGLVLFFRDSLPTQAGTFTPEVLGDFTIDPNTVERFTVPGNGSFQLEITEVSEPEPSSLVLLAIALIGCRLAVRRLRRKAA